MECPYCGSEDVRELGYEDGGGDYGEAVTLVYRCNECGEAFEESDLPFDDDDPDEDDQEPPSSGGWDEPSDGLPCWADPDCDDDPRRPIGWPDDAPQFWELPF